MTPLWLDAAGRPRPTRASMRLKATAWLVGSVGLIIALSGGAQEALPSPAMLSTRLDTLQLAFADELNKPLLEQSLARLRTIAADIDALAREVAFAVRTSDSTRVIGYVGVQEGLKPVHARITLYVSGLQARQESELREKQRSEEVWPQFWAEQEAWQQRRAIEEQREQERERRESRSPGYRGATYTRAHPAGEDCHAPI